MECLHFESFLETSDCPENVVEAITLELDEIKKAKNLENHTQVKWKMYLGIIMPIKLKP